MRLFVCLAIYLYTSTVSLSDRLYMPQDIRIIKQVSRYLPLVPALSLIALAPGAMKGACVDGEDPLFAAAAALATDAS
jgi:hypothetical protein